MYLPSEIPSARILITVKTYPQPSGKYDELVCTAGLTTDGKWIRIYPVPFRRLPYKDQYRRYQWIELDIIRRDKDFRPESYSPARGIDTKIVVGTSIPTVHNWAERKQIVLNELFSSMNDLISCAKGEAKKSLATLEPREIIDFVVEPVEREWKSEWQNHLLQLNLFDQDETGRAHPRKVIRKLPYKYSYKFLSTGDKNPRTLMIEDWELGALFWNCLNQCEGDEQAANELVRKKYFDDFGR